MHSPQFKAYVEDNISLTKSLCIKSQQTIELQNNYLQATGFVVTDVPSTWKYYRNISGEYHISDVAMTVISSDTQETIELTKGNLLNHPLTFADYGPHGIYHEELLGKYPNQRDLILRIFDPVDINEAIEAPDFTILSHDPLLIHSRERSLIPKLQKWLYAYGNRWHIYSFAITDPLYPAAMLAVMYHSITTAIMNFRLESCLTAEVAEFHLWSKLGSKYRLDRYREYLSNRQALYLYRNIDYLRHNVGKEKTLIALLENITEPANIRASKYDVTQDDSTLIRDRSITPMFLKSDYKESSFNVKIKDRYDTEHVVSLTKEIGIHGEEDFESDVINVTTKAKSTTINEIPTGIVELNAGVRSGELFSNPQIQALNHWFYLCSLGKSRAVVELDLGDYGSLSLTLTNTAILLMYALHRLHSNNDNEVIPDVGVRNVLPTRYPSGLDLTATVTESVAEKGYLTLALAGLLGIPLISTTEELRTLGEDVSAQYYGHYLLSRLPHGELDRSALWDTLQSIYVNTTCSLVPSGTTWEAWLTNLEFPSELFTEEEYLLLITNILNIVVGIDIGSVSLSNKHTALIEILKLLTSYGIIFSDGTKDKPGMVYDYPWIFPVGYAYGHSEAHTLLSGVDGLGVKDSVAVSTKLSNSDIILTRIPVHKQSYRLVMSDLALTYVCGDTCTYKLDLGNLESGPVTTTVIEDV